MILGAMDQKLWVFKVSRRSLGSQFFLILKLFWVGFFFIDS
jgi:hypothetical protein